MFETVVLKIDGQAFEGWKSINIKRGLNSLCGSFNLGLTEAGPLPAAMREITDGLPCELWVSGELFLSGWAGTVSKDIDDKSHAVSVSGRDKTSDLVDCSAVHKPGSWRNQKLDKIAADLIKPFGLAMRVEADTGAAFQLFALEQGEDVFSAITRMCRLRGLMITTAADGTLLVFKPSTAKTGIVFEVGQNVKKMGFTTSTDERFSEYILKGQHHGGDFTDAKTAASPKGTAKDAGVKRYRPLILINDEQSTLAGLAARAAWEATTRLARSQGVGVIVPGWRDSTGNLLKPNQLCHCRSTSLGIDRELMIAEVDFVLDDGGSTTAVTLVRPEAFTVETIPEPKPKKKKGKAKKDDSDFSGASQ